MKNHQNAPKKNHHEKTCCAHSRVAEPTAATTTTENPADVHAKNKNNKKH